MHCGEVSIEFSLDIKMNIKMHYLNSHLGKLWENLADVSEEKAEFCYLNVKVMKNATKNNRTLP